MSLDNYAEFHAEHVRLAMLRVLKNAPAYSANDSILTQTLNALGLSSTRDGTRVQLAWLEEQRLVKLDRPVPSITVAEITERGLDVAEGRAQIPGVLRPSPGS